MKKFSILLALLFSTAQAANFDSVIVENALNLKYATPSKVPYLNGQGNFVSSQVGPVQLGYIGNLTSDAQAQLNALAGASIQSVTGTAPISVTSGQNPIVSCITATGSVAGCLSAADWTTFNAKQPAGNYLTALTGDGSAAGPGSSVFTLATVATPGTAPKVTFNAKGLVTAGSALSSGDIPNNAADTSGNAATATAFATLPTGCSSGQYADSIDASGNLTCAQVAYSQLSGTPTALAFTAPLVLTGNTVACNASSASQPGCLSSTDWSTFNAKQDSGNYLTALTGDGSAAGPGSSVFTLATVATPGTAPKVTFNAKGLVTSGTTLSSGDIPNNAANTSGNAATATAFFTLPTGCSSGQYADSIDASGNLTCAQVAYSQLSGTPTSLSFTAPLVETGNTVACNTASGSQSGCISSTDWSTFNAKQTAGSYITQLTGDGTAIGPGSTTFTLATVATPGTAPKVTFNAKGLVTSGTTLSSGDIPNNAANTSGNAATATALASVPTGCSANQFADAIAASGNLTCAQVNYNQLAGVLPNPSATTLGGIESLVSTSHQWINTISTSGVPSSTQPAFTDISGSVAASQLPNPTSTTLGGVESLASSTSRWINTISTSGVPSATQPAFSDISGSVAASQLPNPTATSLGGVESLVSTSHQWINTISTSGVPSSTQPAFTDISGSVAASQLPNPTATTLGGIESLASSGSRWINAISTSGVPSATQPAFTDVSGTLTNAQLPTSGASAGSYTNANITVNAQGIVTAAANGSGAAATAPTTQVLSSTGTTTGWLFTISTSSTVAVNDTYTNNGHTYTVLNALSAQTGQVLFTSGALSPLSSGTLARATGSGTSSITFTASTALATYTTPTSPAPLYIRVRGVGGGGGAGGGASSQGGTTAASSGTLTAFGPSLLLGQGGAGAQGSAGGIGGTASLGTGPSGSAYQGAGGGSGGADATGGHGIPGPAGNSPFGGGGAGISPGGTGAAVTAQNAAANSGSGGTGGSSNSGTSSFGGGGGSAGGFFDAIITSPAASYVYVIGSGGAGGAAGSSGGAGGSGGTGVVIVQEFYQ